MLFCSFCLIEIRFFITTGTTISKSLFPHYHFHYHHHPHHHHHHHPHLFSYLMTTGEGNGKIAPMILRLLQENNQILPAWFQNSDDFNVGTSRHRNYNNNTTSRSHNSNYSSNNNYHHQNNYGSGGLGGGYGKFPAIEQPTILNPPSYPSYSLSDTISHLHPPISHLHPPIPLHHVTNTYLLHSQLYLLLKSFHDPHRRWGPVASPSFRRQRCARVPKHAPRQPQQLPVCCQQQRVPAAPSDSESSGQPGGSVRSVRYGGRRSCACIVVLVCTRSTRGSFFPLHAAATRRTSGRLWRRTAYGFAVCRG